MNRCDPPEAVTVVADWSKGQSRSFSTMGEDP